jgi:hypothetical protein
MIRIFVILIIIISGIWFSLESKRTTYEQRRKEYVWFIMLLLALQSGLRNWNVGPPDTMQYYRRWDQVRSTSWKEIFDSLFFGVEKDPFYTFFQKVIQVFSENFQFFLLVVAAIFMIALGNFVLKNTTRISHAVLAFMIYMGYYYGFFSITGIRQTLATALLLWSYEYVKKEKIIPFTILVLFAALFHISALVFLGLYFVAKIKPKFVFGVALFGFPFFMIFKNDLAVLFLKYSTLEDRFAAFAEQYYRGGSLILTTFQVLLAIYALTIINKVIAIGPKIDKMYNTFALALFFLPLQWVNPSAGRIAQYFAIIIMVWIPYIIDATADGSEKTRKLLYTLAVISFFFLTLFSIEGIDEYKFFWQEMELSR